MVISLPVESTAKERESASLRRKDRMTLGEYISELKDVKKGLQEGNERLSSFTADLD
jgi:hypothetical protein